MEQTFYAELGKSGPWALVAGVLLWTVIKAWNADRATVMEVLPQFRDAIVALKNSVEQNTETHRQNRELLERVLQTQDRSLEEFRRSLPALTCVNFRAVER
ncbi:MAG: hypothetical protein ACO1SV_00830 [Fimbriimonas sp.]